MHHAACSANVHDVKVAWRIPFPAGTVAVDDRGHNDYRLFAYWTDSGVFFVLRMKDNALYEVVEAQPVPHNRNILRARKSGRSTPSATAASSSMGAGSTAGR